MQFGQLTNSVTFLSIVTAFDPRTASHLSGKSDVSPIPVLVL